MIRKLNIKAKLLPSIASPTMLSKNRKSCFSNKQEVKQILKNNYSALTNAGLERMKYTCNNKSKIYKHKEMHKKGQNTCEVPIL